MQIIEGIAITILSICLGILINYLADVLPVTRKLTNPTCPSCANTQSWMEYLLLKRCPACNNRPRIRRYIVLAGVAMAGWILWLVPLRRLEFLPALFLLTYFVLVAVVDIEHRLVLHPVSIAGAIGGIPLGISLNGWEYTLIGGPAGFSIMFVLYYLGYLYTRWISKRRGITIDEVALGFGDVNLGGVIGFLLGWPEIVGGLLLAIILGGFGSAIYILVKVISKQYHSMAAIPYAPYLVLGAMIFLYLPK